MNVHPAIAALRGAPVSQRRPSIEESRLSLESARDAWLARPATRAVTEALKRYGAGESLEACKALHALVNNGDWANSFIRSLLENLLAILRAQALGEAPFRFKVSQGLATIQLIESGGATLIRSAPKARGPAKRTL